ATVGITLAGQEIGDQALALFGDFRHLPRQLGRVGQAVGPRARPAAGGAAVCLAAAGASVAFPFAHLISSAARGQNPGRSNVVTDRPGSNTQPLDCLRPPNVTWQ